MRIYPIIILSLFLFFISLGSIASDKNSAGNSLEGAWLSKEGNKETVILAMDGYISFTDYSLTDKEFDYTWGGTYELAGGTININTEFNSADKEKAGTSKSLTFEMISDRLMISDGDAHKFFNRIDNGSNALAGAWQITGRKQDGKIVEMPKRARKTIKMLTGSRFQWIAINTETGEFFGTGGGTYTFKDGKYTENIEFFSRDSSRVGASLTFDGKMENGKWHHSGISSKGDPIYEIWSKEKQ